jgi:putative transcriptional regulator
MPAHEPTWLRHQLLIAMPQLGDPNFAQTVTWLFEHNAEGAMGVVINRPIDMDVDELLEQLDLGPLRGDTSRHHVLAGGPVQANRGFVLHRSNDALPRWNHGVVFGNGITLATSRDVLEAIAAGNGPSESLIALGYAGWGAGQLEREIAENAWLAAPCNPDLLFDVPFEDRWATAARSIGVDLALISQHTGHA